MRTYVPLRMKRKKERRRLGYFVNLTNKIILGSLDIAKEAFNTLKPLPPKGFAYLKRFSGYTRPMGFSDSIFNVTINSAAVLKHPRLKFTGIVTIFLC